MQIPEGEQESNVRPEVLSSSQATGIERKAFDTGNCVTSGGFKAERAWYGLKIATENAGRDQRPRCG
jgi:hypothetical protein